MWQSKSRLENYLISMNTKTLTFTKELPNCEGQFLIKWNKGDYELINVYFLPKRNMGGLDFNEGFFISSWGRKHVSKINLDMVEGIAKL